MTTTPCLWLDTEAEDAARFYCSDFPNPRVTDITHYGPEYTFSEAVSFQIPCNDQDEVDHYWSSLSEGGREDACGWLKDGSGCPGRSCPRGCPSCSATPTPLAPTAPCRPCCR